MIELPPIRIAGRPWFLMLCDGTQTRKIWEGERAATTEDLAAVIAALPDADKRAVAHEVSSILCDPMASVIDELGAALAESAQKLAAAVERADGLEESLALAQNAVAEASSTLMLMAVERTVDGAQELAGLAIGELGKVRLRGELLGPYGKYPTRVAELERELAAEKEARRGERETVRVWLSRATLSPLDRAELLNILHEPEPPPPESIPPQCPYCGMRYRHDVDCNFADVSQGGRAPRPEPTREEGK